MGSACCQKNDTIQLEQIVSERVCSGKRRSRSQSFYVIPINRSFSVEQMFSPKSPKLQIIIPQSEYKMLDQRWFHQGIHVKDVDTPQEDKITNEVKEELKDEVKEELKDEIQATPNTQHFIKDKTTKLTQLQLEQQLIEPEQCHINFDDIMLGKQENKSRKTRTEHIHEHPSSGTINSSISKLMKIGVDLFVNLKQGSISKFYVVGQVLGQGAYGKVWKVTHKTTGLIRAVKQLKKSTLFKEEEQRLFAEMNILKNLDHPHIVRLYELYQDTSSYYLVTEYLSGGELFDRIKKMSHFTERKAAEYIRQILMAVLYCHEQKIVHRDLKPENIIFVDESPHATLKIIDFGTSRKFDNAIYMTKRLGTPYYIAPEVLTSKYNEKCDLWSCGVILFILLCGYPPFTGKNETEITDKVKKGQFTFNPKDWDFISKEVKTLITKLLILNPERRISAKEALQDPWLVKHAPTNEINSQALENLCKFQANTVFKQTLLSFIACQMTTQMEIDELQKTFQALDKNQDGILSKEELIEGYMVILKNRAQAEEQVENILAQVDINQTGLVDFSEFLMAAMNEEKLLSKKKIEQAFKIFDLNNDGYISKQELEQVMGELDLEVWNAMLEECDKNNDGRISQQEFTKILQDRKS